MRFFQHTPTLLLRLIAATFLLASHLTSANPQPFASSLAGFSYNELFARYECSGQLCGWNNQLCCPSGEACYTNAQDQAQCSQTASGGSATAASGSGHWDVFTTTYVETDLQTVTSVMSSYVSASATAGSCNYALNEVPCGNVCCSGTQYCVSPSENRCANAEGGSSSAYYSTYTTPGGGTTTMVASPSAPVRGTSSSNLVVTQTATPSTTVPFESPVATGANVTITGHQSSGGLSGGAIAGIVIGAVFGAFLLALLCFCCCFKGLLDGFLACFGLGGRRRRTTEVEEYERRSHYDSRGGRRTWFGAAIRPGGRRTETRTEKRSESHFCRDMLGIGACLGALWAILGLKRRNRRKNEERYEERSDYTYSSDYYTSASSASSDDRRTRITRDTRRSVSRR